MQTTCAFVELEYTLACNCNDDCLHCTEWVKEARPAWRHLRYHVTACVKAITSNIRRNSVVTLWNVNKEVVVGDRLLLGREIFFFS